MLARAVGYLADSLRTYRFSEGALRKLQRKRLGHVLNFAYANVPYYRDSFTRAGVSSGTLESLDDLSALPFLTKDEVIDNYDRLRPPGTSPWKVRLGSGTTGKTMKTARSEAMNDRIAGLLLRRLIVLGYRPWTRVVSLWTPATLWTRTEGPQGSRVPITAVQGLGLTLFGRPLPTLKVISSPEDTAEEARQLARARPEIIVARPNHLRRVGLKAGEMGLRVRPKCVSVSSETMTPRVIKDLADIFDAPVVRNMGAVEFGVVGSECTYRRGLHLAEDNLVCEFIRDGRPARPGEVGELVITGLMSTLMPLIRFRTGDMVEVAGGGRCGCGTCMTTLKSVQGRLDDGLVTADGRRVKPLVTANYLESELGFMDYRLVQLSTASFVMRASPEQIGDAKRMAALKKYLGAEVGSPVSLAGEVRPEEDYWAKNRPVASKVPSSALP